MSDSDPGTVSGADFEDLLREVLARVNGALDEQARLRLLLDAVVSMAADLTLDGVLAKIVATARELTGARYAALGVLNGERYAATGAPLIDTSRFELTATMGLGLGIP